MPYVCNVYNYINALHIKSRKSSGNHITVKTGETHLKHKDSEFHYQI
jgi:hypothetical protein